MAKTVYVTGAQKRAAQTIIERSAVTGRFVSSSMKKIAEAKLMHLSRSAEGVGT